MAKPASEITLEDLLRIAVEKDATDLHITVGNPPRIRVSGKLVPVEDIEPLTAADTHRMCFSVMTDMQKKIFEERHEVDFLLV